LGKSPGRSRQEYFPVGGGLQTVTIYTQPQHPAIKFSSALRLFGKDISGPPIPKWNSHNSDNGFVQTGAPIKTRMLIACYQHKAVLHLCEPTALARTPVCLNKVHFVP